MQSENEWQEVEMAEAGALALKTAQGVRKLYFSQDAYQRAAFCRDDAHQQEHRYCNARRHCAGTMLTPSQTMLTDHCN